MYPFIVILYPGDDNGDRLSLLCTLVALIGAIDGDFPAANHCDFWKDGKVESTGYHAGGCNMSTDNMWVHEETKCSPRNLPYVVYTLQLRSGQNVRSCEEKVKCWSDSTSIHTITCDPLNLRTSGGGNFPLARVYHALIGST